MEKVDSTLGIPTEHRKYHFLDGLRGVAAIAVFILHSVSFWGFVPENAYLAVDLFFCLSGFVIASAYEGKLRSGALSRKEFVVIRLTRLYPMFLLSLVACLVVSLGRGFLGHHPGLMSSGQVIESFLTSLFFIPSNFKPGHELFALNIVYWSLFFELLANFIYVVLYSRLTAKLTISIAAVAGLMILVANLVTGQAYGPDGGVLSICLGLTRGVFGIFAGILIFRHKKVMKRWLGRFFCSAINPWVAFLITSALLLCPTLGRSGDAIVQTISAVVLFPLLVLMSADGDSPKSAWVMTMLGVISYPLYVMQVPVMDIIGFVLNWNKMVHAAPLSGVALLIVLMGISVALERIYDVPIRRRLSKWRRAKSAATPAGLPGSIQ